MDAFTWAMLLLVLGMVFLVLEFFVPSSGALAVMCAVSFMGAIAVGFAAGPWTGVTTLLIVCIIVPSACAAAVRWWPDTPIGRLILIQRPKNSDEVLPETAAYRTFKDLVGRRGVTKNLMLPSGAVLIDGKSYDAFSEGMAIEPGQPVIVVSVSTQRLIVRPDTTIRAELADDDDASPGAAAASAYDPNEPLVKDIPDPFA
jgi:membrane-bound ClpP family serine protease